MSPDGVKTRRYNNRGRAEQARQTGQRILAAAHQVLLERGYAGTAVGEVAVRAGVSVETVYKRYGGKAGLVKATYDVLIAGDDDPVPLSERPQVRAILQAPDAVRKLELYAALSRSLAERTGPLVAVLLQARGADPDLERFAATIEQERLIGAGGLTGHLAERGQLRPGLDADAARDVLWTLISPEVYLLLVIRRGWTPDAYQAWLAGAMIAALT